MTRHNTGGGNLLQILQPLSCLCTALELSITLHVLKLRNGCTCTGFDYRGAESKKKCVNVDKIFRSRTVQET